MPLPNTIQAVVEATRMRKSSAYFHLLVGGAPLLKPQWIPPISCVPDRQSTAEPNLLYRVQHGASQASQKGRREVALAKAEAQDDSYAHIIGTSMGRDAVLRKRSERVARRQIWSTPRNPGNPREAITWSVRRCPHGKEPLGGA